MGLTGRPRALAASCLLAVALGGCASQTGSAASTRRAGRAAIERYMGEVEPIRLAVNKLLGGADQPPSCALSTPATPTPTDAPLPADLQQAGRGEIAPSPDGS